MAKFGVDAEICAMGYRMAHGISWDEFGEAPAAVEMSGRVGMIGPSSSAEEFSACVFDA